MNERALCRRDLFVPPAVGGPPSIHGDFVLGILHHQYKQEHLPVVSVVQEHYLIYQGSLMNTSYIHM